MSQRLRIWIQMAVFVALAIALGWAFLYIPNIELITATFFIAGYFLGPARGIGVAVVGEFLYSLLNPLGAAPPPLMAAQIISMGLVAFWGGFSRPWVRRLPVFPKMLFLGFSGLVLTFLYDLFTTLSFLAFAGLNKTTFLASVIYGLGFYVLHIIGNFIIFLVVVPFSIQFLEKHGQGFFPDPQKILKEADL
ncbi:MAG: ECF transporter S component [Calditrichaeota bacterium]|nr:ECF transporter S component [Calditrichota bacterium]